MKNYFNTTGEREQLELFEEKAKTQNERILAFFKRSPKIEYTPSQVCLLAFKNTPPLTSIRRGITTLTKHGKLRMTENKRLGIYGRNEHTWVLC